MKSKNRVRDILLLAVFLFVSLTGYARIAQGVGVEDCTSTNEGISEGAHENLEAYANTILNRSFLSGLREVQQSAKFISMGDNSGAAVMEDGSLWTWGNNEKGQLGNGTTNRSLSPVKIIDSGVRSVSMGHEHAAAVMEDGSLWTWGENDSGELGDGTTTSRLTPVKIIDSGVKSASMGLARSLAVMEDGSLWTWGNFGSGSLGDGTMSHRLIPAKVIDSGVESASMFWASAAAVMEDGSLWMWGANSTGQIGDGTTQNRYTPVKVIESGVECVSAGAWHTYALLENGSLWKWGSGPTSASRPAEFIESGVRSIAQGHGDNMAAIMDDGSLWMWGGNNRDGQLGDGTTESHYNPVEIISSGVKLASVGTWNSGAVLDDGSLWTWGQNYNGALGDGTTERRLVPTKIFGGGKPADPSTGSMLPASDTLSQLAACLLTDFNVGTGFEGKTVKDYLDSGAFVNRAIWNESPQTYEDLFSEVLGGYEIVSARVFAYKGAPHIALRHPSSGDVIIAFSAGGPELIESTGVSTYFNDATEVLAAVEEKCPNSAVYLSGANVGGMAASYLSAATHYDASTFNSPAVASTLLAALTQSVTLSKANSFRGVDDTSCVNYYTAGLEERLGYSRDIAVSVRVSENPLGKKGSLTAFFEHDGSSYELCTQSLNIPDKMQQLGIINTDASTEAIMEMFEPSLIDLVEGASLSDRVSFPSLSTLGDVGTIVALGTKGYDSARVGLFNGEESKDLIAHHIKLTGDAKSDYMDGGTTSDTFVMGEGSATLNGRAGSDLYFIGHDANVIIHDTGATDGNNLVDLLKSTYDLVWSHDITAVPDFAESLQSVLSHTNRDAVVFTNCSFDDMNITYSPAGDYFIIRAGTSRVTVPNRSQDFYIVDASGKTVADGMMLNDLFAMKRGLDVNSTSLMAETDTDYSQYVSFYIDGAEAAVKLVDKATGEELDTISVDETTGMVDVCLEYGTFVIDGVGKTIDGLYDASKISAEIVGNCDKVITNDVTGTVEGDLAVTEDILVEEFNDNRVEIRADENVRLVGMKGDVEITVPATVVEDTTVDVDTPDVPNPPSEPSYPPVISDSEGGTVVVTPERPGEGDEVTVEPVPDDGQEVREVTVTDEDGEAVPVADNGDGTWAFVQPDGAVTVTVAFGCDGGELCPTHGFADVDQSAWYHDAVDWAVENGVLNGYGEGGESLGPVADVTRAEMAQMLWNRAGRPEAEADLSAFTDVDAGGWYAPALEWCVSEGIFSGYGDTFGTERTISREEAVTVLWRISGSPEADADLSGYGDASSVSDYATGAIEWAVSTGVLTGKGGVALDPQAGCTRGEVAAMMMRMAQ